MTKNYRRNTPLKFLLLICLCIVCTFSWAQEVEFIVHHAPGGPSDSVTRLVAQHLSSKNYLVVNRPGASGRIAMRHLLNRPSMMIATMPQIFVTNIMMFPDLEYNLENDIEIVAVIGVMPNVLVCHPKHGFKNLYDLQKHKVSLNFAVAGRGSNEHLATLALLSKWHNFHNIIFYAQGGSSSLIDLLGGTIDCMFANFPLVKSTIKEGRLQPIFTSHEIGLAVDTWQKTFKTAYPIQSDLALIFDSSTDQSRKKQIKQDIIRVMAIPGLENAIKDLGLLPILKSDQSTILESKKTLQRIHDIIRQNQISLKE